MITRILRNYFNLPVLKLPLPKSMMQVGKDCAFTGRIKYKFPTTHTGEKITKPEISVEIVFDEEVLVKRKIWGSDQYETYTRKEWIPEYAIDYDFSDDTYEEIYECS